jgi:hypothetical protein
MIDTTIGYKLMSLSRKDIADLNDRCQNELEVIEQSEHHTKRIDTKHDIFWEIIYPQVKDLLTEDFIIKNGFWNKTSKPYPIHSDGNRGNERIYRTVLVPLALEFNDPDKYDQHKNQLVLFEQTSDFATVFAAGRQSKTKSSSYRYAETHDDYRKMANGFTNTYFHQPFVKEICPHLSYTELFGLSFKGMANWGLRHAIVFHPHILHASSDFTKYGVASKTNLVYSLLLK